MLAASCFFHFRCYKLIGICEIQCNIKCFKTDDCVPVQRSGNNSKMEQRKHQLIQTINISIDRDPNAIKRCMYMLLCMHIVSTTLAPHRFVANCHKQLYKSERYSRRNQPSKVPASSSNPNIRRSNRFLLGEQGGPTDCFTRFANGCFNVQSIQRSHVCIHFL